MRLTRRDLSRLTLGIAVAVPTTPVAAFWGSGLTLANLTERLRDDLNDALATGCEGRFDVYDNGSTKTPYWNIDVIVRLDWPPGYRQQHFTALGQKGDEAYDKALAKIKAHYRPFWPQADGSSCVR